MPVSPAFVRRLLKAMEDVVPVKCSVCGSGQFRRKDGTVRKHKHWGEDCTGAGQLPKADAT